MNAGRHLVAAGGLVVLAMASIRGAQAAEAQSPAGSASARYVFLMIGDGMGPGQRELAERWLKGRTPEAVGLAMNTLPVRAAIGTDNCDGGTTDSAAAATALARGVKTKSRRIGIGADGKPARSIAADVAARGMGVGILTDVPANHATPAGFYGVTDSRFAYSKIAMQLPKTGYDFFAGSGIEWDLKEPMIEEFFVAAGKAGYAVAEGSEGLAALPAAGKAVAVWSRTRPDASEYIDVAGGIVPDRAGEMVIGRFVAAAIARLSQNPKGFFIMAEGGRIDKMGHLNDSSAMVMEILAFDAAVRMALAFRDAHPEDTLVVVTADHETGGLSVSPSVSDAELHRVLSARRVSRRTLAGEITGAMKSGLPFDAALKKLAPKADLSVLPAGAMDELRTAWTSDDRVADRVVAALDAAAGVAWKSNDHTPVDVPLTAIGVGADRFAGNYPNTGVHDRILALLPPL